MKLIKRIILTTFLFSYLQGYAFPETMTEETAKWLKSSSKTENVRPGISGTDPGPGNDPEAPSAPVGDPALWVVCLAGIYGWYVSGKKTMTSFNYLYNHKKKLQ
jgi:hypothetical protein